MMDSIKFTMERQADALERIAAALEGIVAAIVKPGEVQFASGPPLEEKK